MIGSIKGNITLKQNPIVMVDCNGVGCSFGQCSSSRAITRVDCDFSCWSPLQLTAFTCGVERYF